ncbi:hypothetical protein PoB_001473200 [Plakobranchus ocellatus]|uniref:Uncharacterized protein n=1 Tax=Plakobranchus ocellatus TaxID=259542 RepID=A0AAV3Z117_9GAST|nr:hypothetical protein PoB_001473200 [Plakobranchus ocellatus]
MHVADEEGTLKLQEHKSLTSSSRMLPTSLGSMNREGTIKHENLIRFVNVVFLDTALVYFGLENFGLFVGAVARKRAPVKGKYFRGFESSTPPIDVLALRGPNSNSVRSPFGGRAMHESKLGL